MKENGADNKKEKDIESSVADILRSSMIGLMESDMGIYQRITSLASTGFFEQHQTSGHLGALADELLAIPPEGKLSDEGKSD